MKQLFYAQILAITLIAFAFVLYDSKAGYSAFLGGMVCIIANGIFAAIALKKRGARASKQIVRNFYRGEAVKIVVTVVMFTVVFKFIPITFLAFFLGYIASQLVTWFALLFKTTNKL